MRKSVLRAIAGFILLCLVCVPMSSLVMAATSPQPTPDAIIPPTPTYSSTDYTTTADFDGGTKANTTTETDRYNQTTAELELDFPYAEKDANLQSYWRFSDSGATILDETWNYNASKPGTAPDWIASGKFGGGYDFEATNGDYLDTPEKYMYASATLSVWAKPESLGLANFGNMIGKYETGNDYLVFRTTANGYQFAIIEGGTIKFNLFNAVTGPVNIGTWAHIVAVMGTGGAKLYIDGDLIDSDPDTTSLDVVDIVMQIGRLNGLAASNLFDGVLDEPKIYDRALTEPEIVELYNSGVQYKSEGNWTTPLITQPTGDVLNNITIDLNNSWAGNCIDKIEILNSTDAIISTDTTDITSNGTIIRDYSTFDNGFNGTQDNGSFKIKVFLKGTGSYTPIIQRINYTTVNRSTIAYIKWDGNIFDGTSGMILNAISSYNSTLDHKILFEPNEIIYFNCTATLSGSVDDVVVNATIHQGNTDTFITELWNDTWNFTENVVYNLTEMCGDLVNWTTAIEGLYYVNLYIHKDGEVQGDNSTNYFMVQPTLVPGLESDIAIWTYREAGYVNSQANFTYADTVYILGGIQWNANISNVYVNTTLWDSTYATVHWFGNATRNFVDGIYVSTDTIYGAGLTLNTANFDNGTYFVVMTLEQENITQTRIFGQFSILEYISCPAYVNASCYNNSNTAALNLTNRVNLSETMYFNGSIGTTYDTTNVIINITINSTTAWIATLYNGTYSFTGGTNVSLTTIAGDVLNWTTATEGQYILRIEVYRANAINRTIVTEGFNFRDLVRNFLLPGSGIVYRDPCFFEWDLKTALTVKFYDKTKTEAASDIISYLWDFGDGNGGTGANPEHQYQLPGEYNVTMIAYYSNGQVESYSTVVRVVDNTMSWAMYIMVGLLSFIGLLIVGVYAVRKKSKKLSSVMYIILTTFILISIVVMQMFIT